MIPKMSIAAMSSVVRTGRRMKSAGLTRRSAGLISTRAPGSSRSWPSVTTRSPAATPWSITTSLARRRPTFTGRDSTVWSAFTTNTNGPCWPACTACAGTTMAGRW